MADNNQAAALASLGRIFGNALDKDVLIAVLEMCNGNAKEAEKYLQATDGGGYDPRQLSTVEGGIPQDYPGQAKAKAPTGPFARMQAVDKDSGISKTPQEESPEEKMKKLFIADNVSYQEHFNQLKDNPQLYIGVLLLLLNQGVEISKASRARILAAAWAQQNHSLPDYLLTKDELFGLPQVLGALALLDAGRKVRAIEKKIARLEKQGTVKAKKLGQLRSTINDLKREEHIGSVSGALSKHIRRWLSTIPSDKLEFFALNLPKGPWTEIADLVHANPNDFKCKWFLEYTFGKDAPQDSVVNMVKTLSAENVVELLKTTPIPYSYLRLHVKPIPEEAKSVIAKYAPLDTIIWYYEELANAEVDMEIDRRLIAGEQPNFGYGKLMERMLLFKSINAPFFKKLMPIAEDRLRRINLRLESPVVVIGDASYSMDVAIRVSTVISSVLTALANAELKFFTGECVDPPIVPRNVPQVLDVASGVKADGLTAPAAALYPYYMAKKVVKFFIVVTDEIENEKYKNWYFPDLFEKYYHEVFPSKIVFVSFLENPAEKGRMVTALERKGIVPLQFILDGKRPDLTKLDSLLGLLASESSFFPQSVTEITPILKEKGITAAVEKITEKRDNNNNINNANNVDDGKEEESIEVQNRLRDLGVKDLKDKKPAQADADKDKMEESKDCIICEERKSDTALLECGHLNFCSTCSENLKECPICRQKVVRTIRIYQH